MSCLVLLWLRRFDTGPWVSRGRALIATASLAPLPLILALGIVGDCMVQPYWAPFKPIAAGNYVPPGEINGTRLHFDAEIYAGHVASFVLYAYAVFVDAVPSVLWVLAGLVLLSRAGRRTLGGSIDLQLVLLACALVPLAYGLLQINVAHRYLNLFLALTTLVVINVACGWLTQISTGLRWGVVLLFLILLVGEVLPFRPFYGPFRPIWLSYADARAPVAGQINPSWMGWGEEMMLVGRKLRAHANQRRGVAGATQDLTIYSAYSGEWVIADPRIHQRFITDRELAHGAADYYLVNRTAVVCGFRLPEDHAPDLVLSFRGFEQAWCYEGQRLHAAGFVFDPAQRGFVRRQAVPRGEAAQTQLTH
jgi:hypothetical protein